MMVLVSGTVLLGSAEYSNSWESTVVVTEDSPARVLQNMQGKWRVAGIYLPTIGDDGPFPGDLGTAQVGSEISIHGNSILSANKLVATIANDLDLPQQEKEIGLRDWRLMLLTLPTGKGVLCSYDIAGDAMEIAYTYRCSCHRGSGHILRFERTKE